MSGRRDLVNEYFDVRGRSLAAMVYGKRTASSLYALAQTLRRRSLKMGTTDRLTVSDDFDEDDDNRETRVVEAGSLNAKAERKSHRRVPRRAPSLWWDPKRTRSRSRVRKSPSGIR